MVLQSVIDTNSKTLTVDTDKIAKGFYILKIQLSSGEKQILKVIKH